MPKYNCVSIGNSTVDIILKSSEFKIVKDSKLVTGTAICEIFDSKVNVDQLFLSSGGGATNTSCALAHFGLKTSCISKIGTDSLSEVIIDDLNKFKVDFENLDFIKNEKTAISVVLTPSESAMGRTALAYRPKTLGVDLLSIKNKTIDAEFAYITNLGSTFLNTKNVIDFVKNKGTKIFWNPGLNELENIDLSIFEKVDYIIVNLEEASKLSSISIEDTENILRFFLTKLKNTESIITMGEKGAFYIGAKGLYHIAAYKVETENTIGAGDAFGSGFLYGVIKNMQIEQCLEYAMKNATSVIKKTGAKEGFLQKLSEFPPAKIRKIK